MRSLFTVISLMAAVCLFSGMASSAVFVEMSGESLSYTPGTEHADSVVNIIYNEYLPKTSWMYVHLDGETIPREQISLDRYLHEESYFDFQNQSFDYDIVASGLNTWEDYPEQSFSYRVGVQGLCGNSSCIQGGETPVDVCSGPDSCGMCNTSGDYWYGSYPCQWQLSRTSFRGDTIDGDPELTGLEFKEDAGQGFQIPRDVVEGSVYWFVEESVSNPVEVEVTMREACKGMSYGNSDVASVSGWITRQITPSSGTSCLSIPGGSLEGTNCRVSIYHRFDHESLGEGYRKYGGPFYPSGGIYKDDVYQQQGTQVEWNGTAGEILIRDFDSTAYYYMVYLPANGPMVCAYTSYSQPFSEQWTTNHSITGATAGYNEPYSRVFSQAQLEGFQGLEAPDCPIVQQHRCNKGDPSYSAEETSDPTDSISLDYSWTSELEVTGTADAKTFPENETASVDLSEFDISMADITDQPGNHSMRVVIREGQVTYFDGDFGVFVCSDGDGDGYCIESGDCNDSNPELNPGLEETCDGIDNNCNGLVDEGIVGMGENIGQPCNNWPGSTCAGTWVCSANGSELICLPDSGIYPGDRDEYCNNKLDDDCDGTVDEAFELVNGTQEAACIDETVWCIEGAQRLCGQCRDGVSYCVNGVWSECIGPSEPGIEVCNRLDDDCDGTVDNVYGENSVEGTSCACYGGGFPSLERCNAIDDDCDGEIDEGATNCCTVGSTRECGVDTGSCRVGIQSCVQGSWGECTGAINPSPEVCCDGVDNNCNGDVDEGCSELACERGNELSLIYWSMIGIGALLLMGVLIYIEFFKEEEG